MANYELGKDHYLHHQTRDGVTPRLHSKGEKVDWDGPPSASMIPLDGEAKKRSAEADAGRKMKHEELRTRSNMTKLGWTPGLETSFLKTQKAESPDPQIDSRPSTRARRAAPRN